MTAAASKACIGWLHENCYMKGGWLTFLIEDDVNLLREHFLVGGMSNFLALG